MLNNQELNELIQTYQRSLNYTLEHFVRQDIEILRFRFAQYHEFMMDNFRLFNGYPINEDERRIKQYLELNNILFIDIQVLLRRFDGLNPEVQ